MPELSRRLLLTGAPLAVGAAAVVARALPAEAAERSAAGDRSPKTVYVSFRGGSDQNDGTSTERPWKTIERLNAAFAAREVVHGDRVRLCRGGFYWGGVRPPSPGAGETRSLTIDAYGSGPAPVVSAYKSVRPGAWQPVAGRPGCWDIDLNDRDSITGNTASRSTNVGFLNVSGTLQGSRAERLDQLDRDWRFFVDPASGKLIVACSTDPSGYNVEAAVDDVLLQGQSNLTVRDVHFTGTGGHGYNDDIGVRNVLIENCRFAKIGGSLLQGATRYGNGVQIWQAGQDVTVRGCVISDCYDAGVTVQGWGGPWRRIRFEQNVITRCEQAFEVWTAGMPEALDSTIDFTANSCIDSGYGWWHRPARAKYSSHVITHQLDVPVAVSLSGNTFGNARSFVYAFDGTTPASPVPPGVSSRANTILWPRNAPLVADRPWTGREYEAFSSATRLEDATAFLIGDSR